MADPTSAAAAAAAPTLEDSASEKEGGEEEDAVVNPTVTVNIKTLNGPDFELLVGRDEPVSELKTKVRRETNVEEGRQRLIYRGKVLADAEPLSTYKVEDGHFVHMVARPEGVPTPAAAAAAAPPAAGAGPLSVADLVDVPGLDDAQRFYRAGGLNDRLLTGVGAPAAGGASAAAAAAAAGGRGGARAGGGAPGRNNDLLDQGDFLSNMLGLGGALGGGGGGGGGRGGGGSGGARGGLAQAAGAQNWRDPAQGIFDVRQGQGARGQGGGTSAAARPGHRDLHPPQGTAAGGGGGGGGGANLEHVRQGLLTLHTLLSGTASRRRRDPSRPAEAADAGAAEGYRNQAVGVDAAAPAGEEAPGAETTPVAATAGAAAATPTRQEEPPQCEPSSDSEAAATGSPDEVETRAAEGAQPVAIQEEAGEDPAGGGGGQSGELEGGSKNEREQGSDRESRPGSGSESDAGAPSLRWPFLAQQEAAAAAAEGRGSGESGSASAESSEGPPRLQSGSDSDSAERAESPEGPPKLRSGSESDESDESSEGPPRLVSDSGESDDNGDFDADDWGDHRALTGRGWSTGFLQGSRDSDEEECKEDGESPSNRRRQKLRRRFYVGQWLDVKDTVNNWLEATVMDMTSSGSRLQIHYNGWPPRWDEWLSWDSPRIAPFRTRTQHLPQAQHVSPAPVSAVRNAPRTGPLVDDVRVLMPEVQRVLQEIVPMVDDLSACYAQQLEQDPATSSTGGRAVSHMLPWTRRRVQESPAAGVADDDRSDASAAAAAAAAAPRSDDLSSRSKAADLAGDIAPLFDRLGRMLTDVAPHLARLSAREGATLEEASRAAAEREDAAEPGELAWGPTASSSGQGSGGGGGGGGGRGGGGREGFNSPPAETTSAFRQLVSTSSPAPTSSNINIHIHAIVPLRGPPSPPPPPPPPPPTASASAVATPTRAERPPLAGGGSGGGSGGGRQNTNRPWNGNSVSMDAAGDSASLVTNSASTPSARGGGDSGSEAGARVGGASGRAGGAFPASSFPADLARESSPPTLSSAGSLSRSTRAGALPSSSSSSGGGAAAAAASGSSERAGTSDSATSGSGHGHGHGHRRGGGWRGFLRALGMGGNSGSSRVSGRRDGGGNGSGSGNGGGSAD